MLSAWVKEILVDRQAKAKKYYAIQINEIDFFLTYEQVNKQVNLLIKSCSCFEFYLEHMPCEHVMLAHYTYKIS